MLGALCSVGGSCVVLGGHVTEVFRMMGALLGEDCTVYLFMAGWAHGCATLKQDG